MKKFFLLTVLLALGLMPLLSQTAIPQVDVKDANFVGQIPTKLSWEAQSDNKKWADQQAAIDHAKVEADNSIAILQVDVSNKLQDAKNAEMETEILRKKFLDLKKLIPKDPWRELYGEKKYVNSPSSGFLKFSGQIHEVAENGIRVIGQVGDSTGVEYFVINFPYQFKVGESVDPSKIYVAFEDGEFSYITEDGYAKKIPKFNYGKPCARPENADAIELVAKQLTRQEEALISPVEVEAKRKHEIAVAAQQRLKDFRADVESKGKRMFENLKSDKEVALKANQERAKKGEPAGLRRMGERYRDGDGVKKDLNISAEYYKEAEDALQAEAKRQSEETRLKEQEVLKEKFLRNLELAEKKENVYSLMYLSNCYSNGIGTEIDLIKAKEFYDKAVSVGLPRRPNQALY